MTTNYTNTFIRVAQDSALTGPKVPAPREKQSIAQLQYELLIDDPYALTSDDLLFDVHAIRKGIADEEREAAREEFFSKSQACLRASPLPKTHGWGLHHDVASRIALIPLGSDEYRRLSEDEGVQQLHAMRSKRA
ncbi:DUF6157 family protein [Brevibacterium sp.]|uniref:DUF6157 family protein n=1 Tax=Brevibacterium sp. TaxID=1701 RepID=UPI0028114A47|nr:DUF6157 family protein [Brevibacterium sp.]